MQVERKTLVAFLVAATTFMEILDATVISTALPVIAQDFGIAAAHLSIGISSYLVALTVFIPLSGWLTQRFGARRIFTTAIVIFTTSSVLCAMSESVTTFTLSRILQGMGGAMMVPVGRLVVLHDMPKNQIVKAVAILTWPALTAPLIGPILGGWVATAFSWHWIFLMNIPLGIVAFIAALILVEETEKTKAKFDFPGFLLCAVGFTAFMAGLEILSQQTQFNPLPMALFLCGLVLLIIASWYLKKTATPLIQLSSFAITTFRVSSVGGSLIRVTINAVPFLLPLMFQLGFGYSPVEAGALLLWLFAGNLLMKVVTTWIITTFGFRKVLLINGCLVAIGFVAIGLCSDKTPYWLLASVLFMSGANRSMHFTALNTMSFSDIPKDNMRDANTLSSVLHQVTQGLGIAIGALLLAITMWICGASAAHPVAEGFQLSFFFLAGIALVSLFDSYTLPANAGESVLTPAVRSVRPK